MTPTCCALLFLLPTLTAYRMAFIQNEAGQFWNALFSSLAGIVSVAAADAALGKSDVGMEVVIAGGLVLLRFAFEIGYSIGMLCPDRVSDEAETD